MNRQVHILPDAASVARRAAETIVDRARGAVETHGSFCLVLADEAMLEAVQATLNADPALGAGMPWARTHLFLSHGETTVGCHGLPLATPRCGEVWPGRPCPSPGNVHRVPGDSPDAAAVAQAYAATVPETFAGLGRVDGSARFDLVVLEVGGNAQVAALRACAAALHEISALAVAVPPLSPGEASSVTLTRRVFNRAAAVLMVAMGGDKADALWRVLEGPANFEHLPAQAIRPEDGALLWLVDEPAAGRLSPAWFRPAAPGHGWTGSGRHLTRTGGPELRGLTRKHAEGPTESIRV